MFKNKFFVFTIVLLFLLSIGLVSANENSTDNVLDDSIQNADDILSSVEISDVVQANQSSSSSEGSFNDLQNLVSNAEDGDTINLDKDYVYSDGDSKGIVVKKSLTIDGSNHEIDGMRQSGIFLLGDTNSRITVILKNIKFLDAYDEMGSVIKIAHSTKKITLNIDNCTFENNRAEYNGGVIYIYDEKKLMDIRKVQL